MRIVLFYSDVESFNFFSDVLAEELRKRGHETFILNLLNPPASQKWMRQSALTGWESGMIC